MNDQAVDITNEVANYRVDLECKETIDHSDQELGLGLISPRQSIGPLPNYCHTSQVFWSDEDEWVNKMEQAMTSSARASNSNAVQKPIGSMFKVTPLSQDQNDFKLSPESFQAPTLKRQKGPPTKTSTTARGIRKDFLPPRQLFGGISLSVDKDGGPILNPLLQLHKATGWTQPLNSSPECLSDIQEECKSTEIGFYENSSKTYMLFEKCKSGFTKVWQAQEKQELCTNEPIATFRSSHTIFFRIAPNGGMDMQVNI